MKISRRNFLKGSATALFLAGFNLPVLANTKPKKNLVVIMLKGAMDSLYAVPVIGDKDLEERRQDLILENSIKLALKNIGNENDEAIIFFTGSLYFAGEVLNLN